MAILYEDKHLICDDDAITINNYYMPFGSKRITYKSIRQIEEYQMGLLSGKLRIWGTSLPVYWFHLDLMRPLKDRAIIIDTGDIIKPVVTPDNHSEVMSILFSKLFPQRKLIAPFTAEKIR